MKTKKLLAGVLTLCVMGASVISTVPVSAQDMGGAIVQTAESPVNEFAIGNKDEFAKFMTVPEYWSNNVKVKLTCNIDMEGAMFKPIEEFNGEFNGCGYTVSNFGVQDSHKLFKKFELAFIKTLGDTAVFENVTFENYSIKDTGSYSIRTNSYKAAGFAINNKGYISDVNFKNCSMINVNKLTFVSAIFVSDFSQAAGFVLNNEKSNEKKDEIALYNKADEKSLIKGCSIRNCSVEMKTEKSNINAGFVLKNDRIIQNCESNLDINNDYGKYIGGFCSTNLEAGTIIGCNFSGSLHSGSVRAIKDSAGGFVGVNYGKIMHCNARGDIHGIVKNIGGFVGINAKGIISACKSTGIGIGSIGIVEGVKNIGGFVGLNEAKIIRSNANSKAIARTEINISIFNVQAGGFVGENAKGEISDCTAIKGVKAEPKIGNAKAGGFVGVNKATITNSKATGDVYISAGIFYKDNGCGGFAGKNAKNGNIDGCYAQCKVETKNKKKCGGFVGEAENKSAIKNSTCKTGYVKGYNADGSAILEKAEFCYHKSKKAVFENCSALDLLILLK